MKTYEYKTMVVDFDVGYSKRQSQGPFQFDQVLNEQGKQGWRLNNLTIGNSVHGGSGQAIAIFEREV